MSTLAARAEETSPSSLRSPEVVRTIDELAIMLDRACVERALIVLAPHATEDEIVTKALDLAAQGRTLETFSDFEPNPKIEQAFAASRRAAEMNADAVIAIGGGSCLDVAKHACIGAHESVDRSTGRITGEPARLPLFAAPTTAGTGSEVTPFAAIYVDGKKVSVGHEHMRPAGAILDHRLLLSMPHVVAAAAALDALCQAVESLWATGSTDESIAHARAAGPRLARVIVPAVMDRSPEALQELQLGAHYAGRAIAISKTTASHALSYKMTTGFGVPHGIGVALTIAQVARANADVTPDDCLDERGDAWVRERVTEAASWFGTDPDGLPEAVGAMQRSLEVPSSLAEAGVPEDDLVALARSVDPVRLSNNPRLLPYALIEDMLRLC